MDGPTLDPDQDRSFVAGDTSNGTSKVSGAVKEHLMLHQKRSGATASDASPEQGQSRVA